MKYDYLIVGAGLFGLTCAHLFKKKGRRCLVVDRRDVIGGNMRCDDVHGIETHRYGPHIFHTSDEKVWDFVSGLVKFNGFVNRPVAFSGGKAYSLPFNMMTFCQVYGAMSPDAVSEAMARDSHIGGVPANLEEQAVSLVGRPIYEALIRGYTEKQWGRRCADLPPEIIRRLPVRMTFDSNYFDDKYQGVPEEGYNALADRLLDGQDVMLGIDYNEHRTELSGLAGNVIYTGCIDAYFGYRYGALEYRSLEFRTRVEPIPNFQGNAVVNWTDVSVPYTRVIEHKFFKCLTEKDVRSLPHTVVTEEYPLEWRPGVEPYYPVNDARNSALYGKYAELAKGEKNVFFGGRLAGYRYYDMDKTIRAAIDLCESL